MNVITIERWKDAPTSAPRAYWVVRLCGHVVGCITLNTNNDLYFHTYAFFLGRSAAEKKRIVKLVAQHIYLENLTRRLLT